MKKKFQAHVVCHKRKKKNAETERQRDTKIRKFHSFFDYFFSASLRLSVSAFFLILNYTHLLRKVNFIILSFPLLISAADTFTPAPLMPLLPGDPLELNLKLRETLYEQDESSRNVAIFDSYTIPWIKILPLLLLALAAPFILYVIKNTRRHIYEGPSVYTLIQQMQALQSSPLPPKELAFEVAKLFKMGFENGPSMTYQELFDHIKGKYSVEDQEALQFQFAQLEKIQYQRESPTFDQVQDALVASQNFLHKKDV